MVGFAAPPVTGIEVAVLLNVNETDPPGLMIAGAGELTWAVAVPMANRTLYGLELVMVTACPLGKARVPLAPANG